jgi:hypothetical protein
MSTTVHFRNFSFGSQPLKDAKRLDYTRTGIICTFSKVLYPIGYSIMFFRIFIPERVCGYLRNSSQHQ